MKALSIKEPYATLILDGVKRIETRSWKTNHRGDLLIHASSCKIPKEYRDNKELMKLVDGREMNYGKLICKCKLIDCVEMTQEFIDEVAKNHNEFVSGFYEVGRYAWILDDIKPIDKVDAKGRLGVWHYYRRVNEDEK